MVAYASASGLARLRSLDWLRVKRSIKQKLGLLEPLRLDVYGGYAGHRRAYIWGRALEDELPEPPSADDTVWVNLKRSLRQLESDEVPGLAVQLELAGHRCQLVTDSEGYFFAEPPLVSELTPGWHTCGVRCIDDSVPSGAGTEYQGNVMVVRQNARFGVISDIDDTILQSHVHNRFKQAAVTLLGNAVTRLSFPGARQLYNGLQRAGRGAPFFYVSRSAWSVHAVLEHFIQYQGLPRGPLVLRHVGLFNDAERRRGHKRGEIERILATYPELDFVLIGDSGQSDAFIYLDVAERHPGRVLAILIRNVTSGARSEQIRLALSAAGRSRPPGLLFDDDARAARFCAQLGLWQANDVA